MKIKLYFNCGPFQVYSILSNYSVLALPKHNCQASKLVNYSLISAVFKLSVVFFPNVSPFSLKGGKMLFFNLVTLTFLSSHPLHHYYFFPPYKKIQSKNHPRHTK